MMRTVEVLIVIVIIAGAYFMTTTFAVLPWPREVSPVNLRRLALTTLQTLDATHDLSIAAFNPENSSLWSSFQVALSATLPPNILYNLTVYDVGSRGSGGELYTPLKSISNSVDLGITSDSSSYLVASSNVTFNAVPEKIGEDSSGGTLYILNCSDANGWWITGYSAQSLAQELYTLLSPFFVDTVMVQNTTQLGQLLGNVSLEGEIVQNAVVINTFGEAVPIPASYCQAPYFSDSYANYSYAIGQKVRMFNWTWASIVGYPFYYVSNTDVFSGTQNGWGIYGMHQTGEAGINAFLQGIDSKPYSYDPSQIAVPVGAVNLSSQVSYFCNYYGVYPSPNQTSTRALKDTTLNDYHLNVGLRIFDSVTQEGVVYTPGAVYQHVSGGTDVTGSFLALGLARIPDVRLTALALLSYYQPRLYRSVYSASDTSRLVILQLGLVGGI
ncbi:MAG: hypothetical protein NWF05_11680 [Candidatus Bathyarchaeota archaeon]|nr:hypothetical protein [Candidatus Bathyarchaeota archaeon]